MKLISIISLLVVSISSIAQKPLKREELSKEFFVMDVQSSEHMLPKYKGVSLVFNRNKKELLIYGQVDAQYIIYLEPVVFKGSFYPDNFRSAVFSNDQLSLCSQVTGMATIICNYFNWEKEVLVFDHEEQFDLSKIQTERAGLLLKAGKVNEALATYDSVQFAENYFDAEKVAIELLKNAVPLCEELSTKRKFKDAADLMKRVLAFQGFLFLKEIKTEADLKTKFGKQLHGMTLQQFEKAIQNYCQTLIEAKLYDDALGEIHFYKKYFPSNANFLMYMGDAYYGKKDKPKASEWYQAYVNKMKELKKEKDIPAYVYQRID